MTPEQLIAAIETNGAALAAACEAAPDAQVGACPEWTNTALLSHMGDVYNFMGPQIAATGTDMVGGPQRGEQDAATWFTEGHIAVLTALRAADPAAPAWSWSANKTKDFYFHRLASETVVHRWDAQHAAGDPQPVEAELATDAIDEVIAVSMQATMGGPRDNLPEGSFHLHRTDGDGEWMLHAEDGAVIVTHEHGKGDAALRGAASDLLLFLWGRDTGNYELFGDEAVARAWGAVAG